MTATRSPFETAHRIGRLDVVASVHDLDNAMAYRPRLESLAWEKFPDVMRGIFDKFASTDTIFQLDKLELDLGTVRPAFLEVDAIAALKRALEEALARAIHDAKSSKHDDRRRIGTPVWRLRQFESFLCDGRSRFSSDLPSFDPTTEAIWLLDNEPGSFLAMLASRTTHRHALERLFLQLSEKGREALFKRLVPSRTAKTMGLLKDMDELLARFSNGSLRISGAILQRKFWAQAIAYLLQVKGASHDPKRLLTHILASLAKQTNISLPELMASINAARLAIGDRSNRPSDLANVLAAMKAEQGSDQISIAAQELDDIAVSGIEDWRRLFDRQLSSGAEQQVRLASLSKAQFEALLKAWAPDSLLQEKSKIIARSLSRAAGADEALDDEIGEAIFEHIAAHIDNTANLALLWKHVLSSLKPTRHDPELAGDIIKILLSQDANVEQEIAAILDRALGQGAAVGDQPSANMAGGENTGQAGHESFAIDREWLSPPDKNDDSRSLSRLKSEINTALAGGNDAWRQLLPKYAWTADQKRILFETLSPREFGPLNKRTFDDAEIASEIVGILSSEGEGTQREIATILGRAVEQDAATSGQSSGGREGRDATGRGGPETANANAERSSKPDGQAGGTSNASLRADIVTARERGVGAWRSLLQKYAQTADDRAVLSDILSPKEFESLLVAIVDDRAMPATQRAFISAISQAMGTNATASINAALLEYLAMQGRSRVESKSLWQHLLIAVVPTAEYVEIRPRMIGILLSGNSRAEQELAAFLADDPDYKSVSPSSQLRNPMTDIRAPTQESAPPKADGQGKKAGLDHSDVARRILEQPTEWRALLRTYAQTAEQRVRLLAAMNPAQFGSLLQAATGDPRATATLRALLSALSLVIGVGAEARMQSVILEYLASHDSHPVDIAALWLHSLDALFPASMSAKEKSAKARKIFDLLPYHDDRLGSGIFHALVAAGDQRTAFQPEPNRYGSQPQTEIKNANFIASALRSDDPSLLEKLRAAIPRPASISPLPSIIFGKGDFETIVRRLRSADNAPIFSGIKAVLDLQRSKPFIAMRQNRLAELIRYLVIADLLWQPHERINSAKFWELLIERLAKSSHMSVHDLVSRLQFGFRETDRERTDVPALQKAIGVLAEQYKPSGFPTKIADEPIDAVVTGDSYINHNIPQEDASLITQERDTDPFGKNAPVAKIIRSDREVVATYLEEGGLQEQREILVRVAKQDPAWLAALARKSVSSTTDPMVLAERLLTWLRPPEILEFLSPDGASALMQKLPQSGYDEKWWKEAIAALLAGKTPAANSVQRTTVDSETEIAEDVHHAAVIDDGYSLANMPGEDPARLGQDQDFAPSYVETSTGRISQSDREAVTAYLEKGGRLNQRQNLVRAAKQDSVWLAELVRKSVTPTNGAEVVAERLLFRLTPAEILEFLAPSDASTLMQNASQFGDDGKWWTEAIAALLAGRTPAGNSAPRTKTESETEIADDHSRAAVTDDGETDDNMPGEDTARLAQGQDFTPSFAETSTERISQSDREAVTAYLQQGGRLNQREILVRVAKQDPAWLAELVRKSVASTTDATVVTERLLSWLGSSEILSFLAPAGASTLMQKAPKSGDDEKWWQEAIAALLTETATIRDAAPRGPEESETGMTGDRSRAAVNDDGEPDDNMPGEDASRLAQGQDFTSSFESESVAIIRPSDRRAITAYIENGTRPKQLEILVNAAQHDPAWLAELARKTASSTTVATAVAQRLLYWLMPIEILEFLAPALASALMQSAPKAGKDHIWWTETIAALLLGEVPSATDAGEENNSPVPHFDRLASLEYWLSGGNPPENATEQFLRLTQAEQISLLRADTVDATLQKIQYAAALLGLEKTNILLQDIIGWAAIKKGPLAALIGENEADQHSMLLRAAASSLVRTEIDLNILADPLPAFSDANQMDAPEYPGDPGSDKLGVSDLMAWLDGRPAKAEDVLQMLKQFDHLIDSEDSQLLNYISSHFYRDEQRKRWVGLLPKASLGRLLNLIAPNDAKTLHDGILLLTTAASQLLTFGSQSLDSQKFWIAVFDAVARPRKIDIVAILSRLVVQAADGNTGLEPEIRARAVALAGEGDHITIAAALRRNPRPEAEQDVASPTAKPSRGQGLENFENDNLGEEEEESSDQPIYIANAGLILINPFLPALFERLDLLSRDENDKPYIDSEPAASRAVHLLQYLVTGQTASPEPLLFLNKIICGLPTGTPVASAIEPDPEDIEICNGLLEGMLENWPALHGTSVDGLRETFLQREGRLNYGDEKWSLVIQRKTLDILKDQIPWNTSVIYHPWMKNPIHVTW